MIYAPTITTETTSAKDAHAKVQVYRQLFNVVNAELLTHVCGVFYDIVGDCAFLNQRFFLVTITARSIRWFDPSCGKEITVTPSDTTFELRISV